MERKDRRNRLHSSQKAYRTKPISFEIERSSQGRNKYRVQGIFIYEEVSQLLFMLKKHALFKTFKMIKQRIFIILKYTG